jgi:dihydroflavonol-4-reductase
MVLVTGATGLLGSHLVGALLQKGEGVRALYRSDAGQLPYAQDPHIEWIKADILDVVAVEQAMDGVQQVYHCAGVVSFNPRQADMLHRVNREGTANVVNACLNAGVEKLLFVSSVAALGRLREDGKVHEGMMWTPETSNSRYGESKYLAETEVWRGIGEGLNAVIVNPVIILGAGDWSKGSSGIFKSAYDEFPWYTEGVSGFVDVLDVVKAMILLMNSAASAERFILSADNLPYRELFSGIALQFGKKPPHKKVTPFLAQVAWRWEGIKAAFSGATPLLTKETSRTGQSKVYFDNSKVKSFLKGFEYIPIADSIERICGELKEKYSL